MKRIEPGCLAIIINSKSAENIGKTVRCLYEMPQGVRIEVAKGLYTTALDGIKGWVVETVDGYETLVVTRLLSGKKVCTNSAAVREDRLMRIGDEDYAKQIKEVLENVH